MEKSSRKRIREMSLTGSLADPVLLSSSDEETKTLDENHPVTLSPQSPADHERGHQPLEYVPKSLVYPPPDDSSENAELGNNPDLETPREQISHGQGKPKEPDHATDMKAPADAQADMDHLWRH